MTRATSRSLTLASIVSLLLPAGALAADFVYEARGKPLSAALDELADRHPDLNYVMAGDSPAADVSVSGEDIPGLMKALFEAYRSDAAEYEGIWVVEGADLATPVGESASAAVGLALAADGSALPAFATGPDADLPQVSRFDLNSELLRGSSQCGDPSPGFYRVRTCVVDPADPLYWAARVYMMEALLRLPGDSTMLQYRSPKSRWDAWVLEQVDAVARGAGPAAPANAIPLRGAAWSEYLRDTPAAEALTVTLDLHCDGALSGALDLVSGTLGLACLADPCVADVPVRASVAGARADHVLHALCAAARVPEPTLWDTESCIVGQGLVARTFLRQLSVAARAGLNSVFNPCPAGRAAVVAPSSPQADAVARSFGRPLWCQFVVTFDGDVIAERDTGRGHRMSLVHLLGRWKGVPPGAGEPVPVAEFYAAQARVPMANGPRGPLRGRRELPCARTPLYPCLDSAIGPLDAEGWQAAGQGAVEGGVANPFGGPAP